MKIEINHITNKKRYLEEVCDIQVHIAKLLDNPHKRIILYTKEYYLRMILIMIIGIIVFFLTRNWNLKVTYVFMGFVTFAEIIVIINCLKTNKVLNQLSKEDANSLLTINEKTITLENHNTKTSLSIKTEDLKMILITKYCITFIRKEKREIPIFIPIEYQEEIKKALKKYHLETMIIKNK